jgi:regulator of cell morphogenesis and NO signaling
MPHTIDIDPDEHLGRLAVRIPAAARVFARHHLDFCCSGALSLRSACERAHLKTETLITDIRQAIAAAASLASTPALDTMALDALIQHIVLVHHEPERTALAELHLLAIEVAASYGDVDPRLHTIAATLDALAEDLTIHMAKEEQVLFPWIRSGQGRSAGGPIAVMHREHERCGHLLADLYRLSDAFAVPDDATVVHQELLLGLADLDCDLRLHMHAENAVLFPRALAEGGHPSGW